MIVNMDVMFLMIEKYVFCLFVEHGWKRTHHIIEGLFKSTNAFRHWCSIG